MSQIISSEDTRKKSGKFWTFRVSLCIALLFIVFLPSIWVFQVIRSLRYEIVREHVALECPGCSAVGAGKLRTFSGFPGGIEDHLSQTSPSVTTIPVNGDKTLFKIWCRDLPGGTPEAQNFQLQIGARTFTGTCASPAGKSGMQVSGVQRGALPGERFVYFVFLPKLKSDAAWASAELMPNFIILNWENLKGFLLHSFSFSSVLVSFGAAFMLVFFFRYLWMHPRLVFATRIQRPGKRFYITLFIALLIVFIAYAFPVFHNIVLLYFALLLIAAIAACKLFFGRVSTCVNRSYRPSHIAILCVILIGSFWLRAHKADWGFPLLLYPDEYAIATLPPQMAVKNSLDPIDFERPNHPSIYLNSILYGVASHVHFHKSLPETFADNQNYYYYLSRIAVAVLGVLSVLLAFLIGAEFHPRFGLLAALLFALYPQFIVNSHYITPDVSLTLLLSGVVLFCIRYVKNPSMQNLLFACACAAFASGEKYPGLLTLIGIAFTLWTVHRRDFEVYKLLLVRMGLAYFVFLFFAAPFVVLKPHLVLLNLISESRPTHPGQDGLGFFGNLMFYVHTYASNTSLLMLLFFVIGVIALFKLPPQKRKEMLPFFLGFVYWIILSGLPLHWDRWILPMVVSPLLLTAYGMHVLWGYSERLSKPVHFAGVAVIAILTVVVSANLLLKNAVVLSNFEASDTRLIGTELFKEKGIVEQNSLSGHYTPLYPAWRQGFDFITSYNDTAYMQGRRYAVISSNAYNRYFQEPAKYPAEVHFYNGLFTKPLVLDLNPSALPETFSSFNDFKNLSRAGFFCSYYKAHHTEFSSGPEIRVYQLDSLGTAGHS